MILVTVDLMVFHFPRPVGYTDSVRYFGSFAEVCVTCKVTATDSCLCAKRKKFIWTRGCKLDMINLNLTTFSYTNNLALMVMI